MVTTLLINFIMLLFVQMMLEGALQDPMSLGWPQSAPIVEEATLPPLFGRMRVHSGLLIGLAAVAIVHVMIRHTVWGYEIRAVGENASAARYAGIPVNATMIRVALISGGLAGLAGVGEVAGLKGYLTADLSPGFGYAGIVVAMLAGLSPLGVVAAALFVAGVFVGADSMSRAMGVSRYLADLVVAMSLLCVLVGGFVQSQAAAAQYISASADDLGGAEQVVNAIFHTALLAEAFKRAHNRTVGAMSFEILDKVSDGDRKARLGDKQPAVLEYIQTNIEDAAMASTVMLFALAMDFLC